MTEPRGWIQTYTGLRFWPLKPDAAQVCILDIAHALSMKCRYSGHTSEFYSVAEHSVLVSQNVPDELALWGLLHDAAEAYLPDIARPIKPMMTGFKAVEDGVMRAVCDRYGLPVEEPAEVKEVDMRICLDEKARLMKPINEVDHSLPPGLMPLHVHIPIMTPRQARHEFLMRFHTLANLKLGEVWQ